MTHDIIAIAAWTIAVALTVPSLMFVVECVAGASPGAPARRADGEPPPFVVLMPAHDEALGIAASVLAVRAQLRGCDRLMVVADNCADDTAAIARSCGAEVVTREDPLRRGKGFALAAGRESLMPAPPEIVLAVDADCIPATRALRALAQATPGDGVAQGLYLMSHPAKGDARTGISTFAFLVKNLVRQRGLKALGAPALLQGSGMAFSWPVFAAAPLATSEIVEDLELGLSLALTGVPLRFVEPARFISRASSGSALASQRTRWEHGSLAVARRYVPRLARAVLKGRFGLLPLLLDILIPPLALLVATSIVAFAGAVLFASLGGGAAIALWMAANLLLLGAVVAVLWFRFGREMLPAAALVRLPAYLLWKLPIYARLFGRRERRWVRTERG